MFKKDKKGGKKIRRKTSKKTLKRSSKRGGAVRMPSRYFGSSHEVGYVTNGNKSTAISQPANTFWNGFRPKEMCH